MDAITGNWKVIENPASNYTVVSGALSTASGCIAQYGNTILLDRPPPTTTAPGVTTTTRPPVVTTTTRPPVVTTTTTAPTKATSLSCPVVTAPTVGQVVSCSYH